MEELNIYKKPIISFCIPTYNRAEKVDKLVREILKYNRDDIEVIVNDNHSTDNTKKLLLSIVDDRFRFYANEKNEGHLLNGIKVMSLAQGDFVFFCLDKDFIKHNNIEKVAEFLKNNTDVAVGYLNLNINFESKTEVYKKGYESLKKLAYSGKHPTGYFCKNEYLKLLDISKRFSNEEETGGFLFEFIVSELCVLGKAAIINIPLCFTEKLDEAKKSKSYTYSEEKDNIFFFPKQRYSTFENYVLHLQTLHTDKKTKKLLLKRILRQALLNVTLVFKSIMTDKDICEHYYVKSRKIGWREIVNNDFKFSNKFIEKCLYKTRFERFCLIIESHFSILVRGCLKAIKKIYDRLGKDIK